MARRLSLAAVLALAACAEQPWSKEGASAEALEQDQRACELAAYQEVQKRFAAVTTVSPAVPTDSTARRLNLYGSGPFADQFGTQLQQESRLTSECMRAKGYERK